MELRILKETDYQDVYHLWENTKGMGLNPYDDSVAGFVRFLKRNPSTNFAAIEDDKIVGILLCGHDGRRGYIYHMAVDEAYRRRGIGGSLVDAAISALQKEGIRKAGLVVFSTNDTGNAFWEAAGFGKRIDLVYRNKSLDE